MLWPCSMHWKIDEPQTVSQYKRKYDGPPTRELRRVDQDPIRVPPHKKPRKYVLTVEYETVIHEVVKKEFISKVAMQEFRRHVEIALSKIKKERPISRYYGYYGDSYGLKMHGGERTELKSEPKISEALI